MAIVITTAKIVAGAILTAYFATRKVDKTKEENIVIDYRKNPEVLNAFIH